LEEGHPFLMAPPVRSLAPLEKGTQARRALTSRMEFMVRTKWN